MQVETRSEPGYLLVRCTEPLTPELLIEICAKAAASAGDHRRRALLVDVRGAGLQKAGMPSVADRYDVGSKLAELTWRHRITLALVGDEPIIDPKRFGELVFLNRAGNGRAFTDFDQAHDWLVDHAG